MSLARVIQNLAWGGLANPTGQGEQLSPSARSPSFVMCIIGFGWPGLLSGQVLGGVSQEVWVKASRRGRCVPFGHTDLLPEC